MTRSIASCVSLALLLLGLVPSLSGQSAPAFDTHGLRYRMLVAEDARATEAADLAPLIEGLASPDARIVQLAVRALGRLERPEFVPPLLQAFSHPASGVRAEAANALGQAVAGRIDQVRGALLDRLALERDPVVAGAICDSLGRLPHASADSRRAVEAALANALGAESSAGIVRLGAARGLEALIRGARGSGFATSAPTVAVLERYVLAADQPGGSEADTRIRRVALTALNATGVVDDTWTRAMLDPDGQVRRLAVAGVAGKAGAGLRAVLVANGLVDRDPMVRYEALRVHGRTMAVSDCAPQISAVKDANPHVALLAIDQLGTACAGDARATTVLEGIFFVTPAAERPRRTALSQPAGDWHSPSHAIVSLVRRDPGRADWPSVLGSAARHRVWQVRMYAARAAEFVQEAKSGDGATASRSELLRTLAADADANVREAAVASLAKTSGHRADGVYIEALGRPDPQVVIAACQALAGTVEREAAAAALVRGLQTLTARRLDTSRDARAAILERLREVAGPAQIETVKGYLSDFDPAIASLAADVLTTLTAQPHRPSTIRLTPLPLPPAATLQNLPRMMRVTMADGRVFDVRLLVDDAPVTVWRIVRLASAGYYNGLTFHRVVPNFLIQGGSPGANEFVGDGRFMRDEAGPLSNTRATIGVSTRGRDTGDAQFYINTVDSPRLDHEYAVFGEVVRGMGVIDLIVEGDVIKRVELLTGGR